MRKCVWMLFSLVTLLCCQHESERCIMPEDCELRAGDIVFRRGGSVTSNAVLLADRSGHYSHVGIVVDSAGVMMVVHAVPGEPEYEGDPDRVKMESPSRFFSSLNACKGEVCRARDSVAARQAATAALAIYHKGVLFDHDYNSEDTTLLYCTQLVIEAYHKAGVQLTGPPTHSYDLPLLRCTCWLPSDIYQSKEIYSVRYFE